MGSITDTPVICLATWVLKRPNLEELENWGISPGDLNSNIALPYKESSLPLRTEYSCLRCIIAESGMTQISDEAEIEKLVAEIIKNNPQQVAQFKAGKETVLMFFVGQLMKGTKGRANPDLAQKIIRKALAA